MWYGMMVCGLYLVNNINISLQANFLFHWFSFVHNQTTIFLPQKKYSQEEINFMKNIHMYV